MKSTVNMLDPYMFSINYKWEIPDIMPKVYTREELLLWYDNKYCTKIIIKFPLDFQFVKNQNNKINKIAIESDVGTFQFIKNPSMNLCRSAMKQSLGTFIYINIKKYPELVDEYRQLLINKNLFHLLIQISSTKNQLLSEHEVWYEKNFCLKNVQNSWVNIQYVKNQTQEICYAALTQNVQALKFIKDIDYDMALFAIGKDSEKAIPYIDIKRWPNLYDHYALRTL